MLSIKVVKISKRWHARLLDDATILDEMACSQQEDIGWICREMLRWQDKMGNTTEWTSSARRRQQGHPVGDIWYRQQLEKK